MMDLGAQGAGVGTPGGASLDGEDKWWQRCRLTVLSLPYEGLRQWRQ